MRSSGPSLAGEGAHSGWAWHSPRAVPPPPGLDLEQESRVQGLRWHGLENRGRGSLSGLQRFALAHGPLKDSPGLSPRGGVDS